MIILGIAYFVVGGCLVYGVSGSANNSYWSKENSFFEDVKGTLRFVAVTTLWLPIIIFGPIIHKIREKMNK